ncbi:MAG: TetR/AcrR family transcriptional regulator [Clostridia bacterium]|nr:TetR/AcrR family transcriptional regulator [Clostridia bacterium]
MTKDKICKSVVKTYNEKGIEGLTVKTVALAAGIGKSTVYEYFSSKEEMVAEAIIYSANYFIDDFYNKEWNQSELNFEETLKSSISYFIEAMHKEFGDFVQMAMESSNSKFKEYMKEKKQKELLALGMKAISYTRTLLKKGQDEKIIRDNISDLDILNFQRIMVMLCGNFSTHAPFFKALSSDIENPSQYVYDHLVKLYHV